MSAVEVELPVDMTGLVVAKEDKPLFLLGNMSWSHFDF
jgi:hypothetical protein